MRVTITGKTASTITFNTLGIVLRGLTSALHIDVKNDEQMRELIGLKNARLIDIIKEDALFDEQSKEIQSNIKKSIEIVAVTKETKSESNVEDVEESDIEDAPTKIKKNEIVRKSGRPKGSKNITASNNVKTTKVKTIKKVDSVNSCSPSCSSDKTEDNGEKETITIMTANGAIQGKCARSMTGDLQESEKTMASIEALRLLEEEESQQDNKEEIDESKLDPSERMGNKATVVNGMNSTASINMKNSSLPEAEAVKNAIKFIDSDTGIDESDDKRDSFIDNNDETIKETSIEDDFLEI